jgi:small subunit ribosomal protein S3
MSRTAEVRQGSLPLSTLQAEIDYGFAEAFMSYGAIGCKVWIFKGLYEAEKAEPAAEPVAAGGRTKARGRR